MAQVKLLPTPEQAEALTRTLVEANAACQAISDKAWETKTFHRFALHSACYKDVRSKYHLSAQVTVRAIAKVADAYKPDHKSKRTFKPMGSIRYDDRILSWRMQDSTISIWTVKGRLRMPFVCGERQRQLLLARQGESGLAIRRGKFFLFATCIADEPTPANVVGALGVDLGITNIAVDSDGTIHPASHVNNVRHRHRRLRAKLQAKGTRSAKRKLKRLSGKERRFAKDINHCLSKQIVAKAKDTKRLIALEDLTGIRTRVTVRRPQRARLHSWAFFQMRVFVEYKAQQAGVPVVLVDPRNTSRTCPACGCVNEANRRAQSVFKCVVCGFAGLADHIAAVNIARRADVNLPIAACVEAEGGAGTNTGPQLRQSIAASHPS